MIYMRFDGVPDEYWNLSENELDRIISEAEEKMKKENSAKTLIKNRRRR